LLPYLFAARLDHPVNHRGEAAACASMPGDTFLLQSSFAQYEIRFHRAFAFHLD
jgi:hypothetical protein